MKKSEINKLRMYEEVVPVLEGNSEVYSDMPILAETATALKSIIDQIKNRDLSFNDQTVDETKQKLALEDELIEKVVKIANGLFLFAKFNGDVGLQVKSKVTKSELASYRITEEFITAATTILTSFSSALGERAEERANNIASCTELFDLFDQTDGTLNEKLDSMVEMYRTDSPNFVNAYNTARVIKDI